MSKVEMALIIIAVIIPLVSILFVLPKRKKKENPVPQTKPYVREEVVQPKPVEQPAPAPKTQEVPKKAKPVFDDGDNDFKAYLDLKKKRMSAPERKEMPIGARGPLGEYIPARLRNQQKTNEDKSVAEQIQDLSPELKALILSGVLDKKY